MKKFYFFYHSTYLQSSMHLDKTAIKNQFSYFSTKTYILDNQKNHLNETVLLSTQNTCNDVEIDG